MGLLASGLVASLALALFCLHPVYGVRINKMDKWPAYVRGKDKYLWATTLGQRMDGLNFAGSNERLRRAMNKLKSGKKILITTIGGSVTTGDTQCDGLPWPQYTFNYMVDQYGELVQLKNGAVGGTRTPYMSVCHNQHVSRESDIIIMEYSVNDGPSSGASEQLKRAQERLVRTMLNYPNKPAVMVAHTLSWWLQVPQENWYHTAESGMNELSLYYHLPTVSIKACCFQDLMTNTTGFNLTLRAPGTAGFDQRTGVSFFQDPAHLDGITGARVMAELVMHTFETTYKNLEQRPFEQYEEESVTSALQPPLFPGNYESSVDRCFVGLQFKDVIVKHEKFDWINEAKGTRSRLGFLTKEPGAVLEMRLDTTAASLKPTETVIVLIAHLRSYEHMGAATLNCVENCTCSGSLLQGHIQEHNSQIHLHRFAVSQAKGCVIRVTVLNATESGEHKVKITGLMVSEEPDIGNQLVPENSGAALSIKSDTR